MSGIQQSKTHRFSVEQYYELGELGLLDRRTELLEGIITDMEPVSPWHANIGDILLHFFVYGSRDFANSICGKNTPTSWLWRKSLS